jgi:O-antigen ligase
LILGGIIVELLCRRRAIARQLSSRTLAAIGATAVLAAIIVIPLVIPRLESAHADDWTIRYNLMRIAVRMIAGNPIVGVGPGAYVYHLKEYAPGDVLDQWLWVVHNEFLLVAAERGLLGLLAWFLWMRSGFRQALLATRQHSQQFQAFGIGCTAAIISLWWEYTLNMWPPFSCYALLWFLFGVLVAGNDVYSEARKPDIMDMTPLQAGAVA